MISALTCEISVSALGTVHKYLLGGLMQKEGPFKVLTLEGGT